MGSSIRHATPVARPIDLRMTMRRPWAVLVQIVLLSVLAITAFLAALPRARAAAEPSPAAMRLGEARSGALMRSCA